MIPVADRENLQIVLYLALSPDELPLLSGRCVFTGRVVIARSGTWPIWLVDTTASRFHPASIAGLVVGPMGVFVFVVVLRDWLIRRRGVGVRPVIRT